MYKKTTLANGLRIISVPQKGTRAVTVLVLVATGSKYEEKRLAGISHFLEHMFFKGTKKRPDKLEIAETLDKVGGIYNAFTGQDYTGYFAKVAADKFELALDWVSDIFLNSLLPEREIRREKGVIIEEINMLHDNPMSHVGLLWHKLLYGDQPAGWDIAGTKETVSGISRQDLLDYMKKQYVASNTVVCLAGKITNSLAVEKVKNYFSRIATGRPQPKPKVIERQSRPGLMISQKPTDQSHLCLGVRGYNLFQPQKYAQDLLGIVLGGMMSSRLFMEVREKLGLAYYIKTEVEANPDTGYLAVRAGVDNKNVQKAVSVILREGRKISQQRLPAAELKKAKDYIKGKMALLLETSEELASFYASQEILKKQILTLSQLYAKIDKVTANDIRNVARHIFQTKNLNLALVGPFRETKKLKELLIL